MKIVAEWILAIAILGFVSLTDASAQPAPKSSSPGGSETSPILPAPEGEIRETLIEVHRKYRALNDGKVAAHTKISAGVNPKLFAIALVTIDGQIFETGDAETIFPLQSLSKAFAFGVALEDRGEEILLDTVGVHATGLPYGSLIATEVRATKRQNPMVSAGAIATTSLIAGNSQLRTRTMGTDAFRFFSLRRDPIGCVGKGLRIGDGQ